MMEHGGLVVNAIGGLLLEEFSFKRLMVSLAFGFNL